MISRSQKFFVSALSATVLVSCLAFAAGPMKLRYKFKQGESLIYKMVMNQSMDISSDAVPGMSQHLVMNMDIEMVNKTLKQEQNAAQIEIGFAKFRAEMKMGETPMPFPGGDGMKKLRFSMRMTDRGEVDNPKLVNPEEVDASAKQLAESMRDSLSQNIVEFPENAIGLGESWTVEKQMPANLPGAFDLKMKLKGVYTLVGIEKVKGKRLAKIKVDMKMSLHGKAQQGGVPLQADLEGGGTAKSLFDIHAGKMVSNQALLQFGGDMLASIPGGQKMRTNLKMKVDVKVDLK